MHFMPTHPPTRRIPLFFEFRWTSGGYYWRRFIFHSKNKKTKTSGAARQFSGLHFYLRVHPRSLARCPFSADTTHLSSLCSCVPPFPIKRYNVWMTRPWSPLSYCVKFYRSRYLAGHPCRARRHSPISRGKRTYTKTQGDPGWPRHFRCA